MTPHTPVEGLVALLAKWRAEIAHYDATCSPSDPEDWVGPKRDCADELEAALASLPVEGWRVYLQPDPPFANPLAVLTSPDGAHRVVVKGDDEVLWNFLAHIAQRQGNEQGGD